MKALHKFLHLTSSDRRLLLRAVMLLLLARLGLRLLPFQTLQRLLSRVEQAPRKPGNSGSVSRDRIVWAVSGAGRYVPTTCLTQAMAACALLKREGYSAQLSLGVASENEGRLQAHAWVESDRKVVIGDLNLDRYVRMLTLDEERP